MQEEIEVKILNINIEEVENKLKEIGAKRIGEFIQKWKTFDYPDWRLDKEGAWVRLRDEGNEKITLSFKKRLGMKDREGISGNDDGMEEIEIYVNDFNATALIFEKIGFIEKHYTEKKRIKWLKDDVEFDIDIYPEIEPYLEIETTSWEKIDEMVLLLGFKLEDKKIFSANQVYALKGIKVSEMQRMTFKEGLVKK